MEAVSGSEARILAWRHLASDARARHSIAGTVLSGGSRSRSPAPAQPADQVYAVALWPERIRGLHRCHRTVGRYPLPARMEDDFGPLSDGTEWIVSLRSAARLLFVDHRNLRSRSGGFRAQTIGRNSIPAYHHQRRAAPRIQSAG